MKMAAAVALCIMLGLALFFPVGRPPAAAGAQGSATAAINPAAQEVAAGQAFSVDITVDPSGHGVSSGEVSVSFNPSIMSADVVMFGELLGADPLVGTKQIDNTAGTIRYALARVGATTTPTSAGKLATVSFTVKDTAAPGYYPIQITFAGLADETFQDIAVTSTDGGVTIPGESAGAIEVTANVEGATFGITGAASYSGTAPWSVSSAPPGDYALTWGSVAGYTTPSSEVRPLAVGGSITFQGSYVPLSPTNTPPSVSTGAASQIGTASATLNGDLTDMGTTASVQASFEWGLTTSYGNSTPAATMDAQGPFSRPLSGLAPGTTYHFRAVVAGDGTSYGNDLTLTTGTAPALPPAAAAGDAAEAGGPPAGTAPAESGSTDAPLVQGVAADIGRQGDVLTVTISGSGLSEVTGLDFGDGIDVTELTVVSDSEISVKISIERDAAVGERDITVTTPGGTDTLTRGFLVDEPGTGVHLWVYLAAVAAGLAALGALAALVIRTRRRAVR